MRTIIFTVLTVLVFVSPVLSQTVSTAPAADPIISVEDIQKTLAEGQGQSLTETVKEAVEERLRDRMKAAEVTEQSVRSAIEGELVVEAEVPQADNTAVQAADTKTKRYAPRIALDFTAFPLRPLSGRIGLTETDEDEVIVLQQTNKSLTEDIARRVQTRLFSPEIRFEFRERTAILTGSVATVRQRELAELMLSLEPGIDRIENKLSVR